MKSPYDLAPYYQTNNPRTNAYYDQFHQRQTAYSGTIMWNWSAFFGTILWLLYRRSYHACLLVFLGMGALLLSIKLWAFFLLLVLPVLFGLFGNNLYFWNLKVRAAAQAPSKATSWKALVASIFLFWPAALVAFGICAVLVFLPLMLASGVGFAGGLTTIFTGFSLSSADPAQALLLAKAGLQGIVDGIREWGHATPISR